MFFGWLPLWNVFGSIIVLSAAVWSESFVFVFLVSFLNVAPALLSDGTCAPIVETVFFLLLYQQRLSFCLQFLLLFLWS